MLVTICMAILITNLAIAKSNNGSTATLTSQEIDDLVHLREEEKLARDVYRYLYEGWNQWIFDNIAASEQQHMYISLGQEPPRYFFLNIQQIIPIKFVALWD